MVASGSGRNNPDSDMAGLLKNKDGANGTEKSVNLDHLTQGKQGVSPRSRSNYNTYTTYPQTTILDFVTGYISLLCYYYPGACSCLIFIAVAVVMIMLANLVFNPVERFGVINYHYGNVHSKYDLSMGKIDHWCLEGGNEKCNCEDPLTPISRMERRSWLEAFKYNRQVVQPYLAGLEQMDLDVAILGGSDIEMMGGRWMGAQRSRELHNLEVMFKNRFSKTEGGDVEALALGIAGDTAPNVLFRILHGEMPPEFNPKIFWISLGLNELGRMGCSEEVVVLGILRVVEEILEKKPNARIVINSLLPMFSMRGEAYPVISDYRDTFQGVPRTGPRVYSPSNHQHNRRQLFEKRAPLRVGGRGGREERGAALRVPARTPEEQLKVAEAEEKRRDEIAKRRHEGVYHRGRDPKNPMLRADQYRIRKYNPVAVFTRKVKIPLWTSIKAINKQLETFAHNNERVSFYDATHLFTDRAADGRLTLKSDMISVRGHPTAKGYLLWEEQIAKVATRMLAKLKRDNPELFAPSEVGTPLSQNGILYHVPNNDDTDLYMEDPNQLQNRINGLPPLNLQPHQPPLPGLVDKTVDVPPIMVKPPVTVPAKPATTTTTQKDESPSSSGSKDESDAEIDDDEDTSSEDPNPDKGDDDDEEDSADESADGDDESASDEDNSTEDDDDDDKLTDDDSVEDSSDKADADDADDDDAEADDDDDRTDDADESEEDSADDDDDADDDEVGSDESGDKSGSDAASEDADDESGEDESDSDAQEGSEAEAEEEGDENAEPAAAKAPASGNEKGKPRGKSKMGRKGGRGRNGPGKKGGASSSAPLQQLANNPLVGEAEEKLVVEPSLPQEGEKSDGDAASEKADEADEEEDDKF